MIFVNRSAIDLTAATKNELKTATQQARDFYTRTNRKQERFKFNTKVLNLVEEDVRRLFADTCAYCETPLNPKSQVIEQFRPKSEACNLNSETDSDWYWWLAYEWENLYLVCQICSLNKKNFFPVIGKRAPVNARGQELYEEKYLLLDPCYDEPAEHLKFLEDGTVKSISQITSAINKKNKFGDRGAVTIEVLGLNRSELIAERQQVIKITKSTLKLRQKNSYDTLIYELSELIDEFSSFVALKRQMVANFLVSNIKLYDELKLKDPASMKDVENVIATELQIAKQLGKSTKRSEKSIALKTKTNSSSLNIEYNNIYIRKLQIRNFRAIKNIEISFNVAAEQDGQVRDSHQTSTAAALTKVGWKMILGENGVGKSSILKALTLALMGEEFYETHAESYRWQPHRIFNNKTREKQGLIKVELSKGDPIVVEFTKESLKFTSGKKGADRTFICGYGSARLFPQSSKVSHNKNDQDRSLGNIGNLFSPESLLPNPTNWLLNLTKAEFDSAALSLGDLLNLSDETSIEDADLNQPNSSAPDVITKSKKILRKRKGDVDLDSGYGFSSLAEQSDGYKSVLALMVDILAGLPKTMHDKREATGIVLIDEIESHLHPRWKMKIVKSLRNTFPGIQFIVTTHDPLCLKGLGSGEITVLKRDSETIFVYDNVSSPSGLRIDQLLTSELFGLDSTIDPDIDEKFYNYYRLLAKTLNATGAEDITKDREQLQRLKDELQQFNKLGFTRRDRLVYDFIDEYIAKSKNTADSDAKDRLREETKQRVFEIWNMVKAGIR